MTNILDAIYNISCLKDLSVNEIKFGNNRATNMGEGLEIFVKNSFTNTFKEENKNIRLEKYNEVFSYQGSKRTPPDLMLKGGDAIEVKKTEKITSELQLNSSFPKSKLFSNSSLIDKHCKNCENWTEKDFIYSIGHIPSGTNTLKSLWFIYGSIYAADENVYTSIKDNLTENIEKIDSIDFSPTNEIGRINYVDPLKITNLRIRGMWLLQPPYKVFDYVHSYDSNAIFQCISIIPSTKYNSFPEKSRNQVEKSNDIFIKEIKVQNPNNPVSLIECKLIIFKINK